MQVVCAACNKHIGSVDSDVHSAETISHGYCRDCVFHVTAQLGMRLKDFLDGLEAPVLAVDANGAVATANTLALTMIKKELPDVTGRLGGDVFECQHAMAPEGCGKTVHCSGCAIRLTVMDTHQTGRAHFRVPAVLNRNDPSSERILFHISTEKVGSVVLLRIDDAEPDDNINEA